MNEIDEEVEVRTCDECGVDVDNESHELGCSQSVWTKAEIAEVMDAESAEEEAHQDPEEAAEDPLPLVIAEDLPEGWSKKRVEKEFGRRVAKEGGDKRKDENGNLYWLSIPQLIELDVMDSKLRDDESFWAWFRAFRDANKITQSSGQWKPRTQVKASDWFGEQKQWKPKYYSDYWGASKWFGSTGTDVERKLAVALQAIQTTVRVVDSHARRMRVRLAQQDERLANYTNFEEQVIQVSPAALLDDKIDQMDGIDITTGWALHEASHAEYTEQTLAALSQPTRLGPLAVSGLLHNLLEDLRIERLTSDKFPGFEGYFDRGNGYLWDQQQEHIPETWGPELNDKMNAIILATKWPTQFQPLAQASGDQTLIDESLWWRAWGERYIAGDPARILLLEGLAHLNADPETEKQMEEQQKKEQAAAAAGESLRQAIKRAIDQMRDGKGGVELCPSPVQAATKGGQAPNEGVLTQEQAQMVDQLANGHYQEHDQREWKFPNGNGAPRSMMTFKPQEDQFSRQFWGEDRADPGLIQRMKSAFFFRPSAMEWSTRNLRSGTVDEDELWRAGSNDQRFFEQRVIESAPDTLVTLLVDCSGSMGRYKLQMASMAAQTIWACLKDMRGVKVKVRAHTGENDLCGDQNGILYDVWNSGEPVSRLGLFRSLDQGDNYDGYALGMCVDELIRDAHPNEQKVVFIIADGLPNGGSPTGHYGDSLAEAHVRDVVEYARRNEVDVISIAIDSALRPDSQARMFRHWLPYADIQQLPMQITALLKKLL